MISIGGIWELGYNVPLKEIDEWRFMISEFEIDSFFMAPVSGIESRYVEERESIQEIISEHRDSKKIVFVDEKAEDVLTDFVHPENVLYVFGRANASGIPYMRVEDFAVRIETPKNSGGLWPSQAAAIVLYDRFLKCR